MWIDTDQRVEEAKLHEDLTLGVTAASLSLGSSVAVVLDMLNGHASLKVEVYEFQFCASHAMTLLGLISVTISNSSSFMFQLTGWEVKPYNETCSTTTSVVEHTICFLSFILGCHYIENVTLHGRIWMEAVAA